MAPFYIRKEDKDMIKRKIDRYLADFFKTDKKRVCHIPWHTLFRLYILVWLEVSGSAFIPCPLS